jgi:phytoene dehydrogenase-like protein
MDERTNSVDVAVVGAGLGGLASAAYVARGGCSVLVAEKAAAPGGRAATTAAGAYRFNLGAHALYAGSRGIEVLRELGVQFRGAKPSASGAFAIARGTTHALPGGFVSLVTTGLFGLGAKLETARLLGGFARIDPAPLAGTPIGTWIATHVQHPDVRLLVGALVRVTSYCDDPERMSAGAALAQIQSALGRGVLYLDGGWQTLVDGLRTAAERAGARVCNAMRVDTVERLGPRWRVRCASGATIDAGAVIIAAGPEAAAGMLSGAEQRTAQAWAETAVPVRAATLDLALTGLPRPRATFALGIDRPYYFSVHSAVAKLGPDGSAVIHVMKYLGTRGSEPKRDERELESVLDLVQPGWRDRVRERRFLPDMLVANDCPAATRGGLAGRPGPAVPDAPGLYVVGDWVGPEGMLADASLASAKHAATAILARADAARAAA